MKVAIARMCVKKGVGTQRGCCGGPGSHEMGCLSLAAAIRCDRAAIGYHGCDRVPRLRTTAAIEAGILFKKTRSLKYPRHLGMNFGLAVTRTDIQGHAVILKAGNALIAEHLSTIVG